MHSLHRHGLTATSDFAEHSGPSRQTRTEGPFQAGRARSVSRSWRVFGATHNVHHGPGAPSVAIVILSGVCSFNFHASIFSDTNYTDPPRSKSRSFSCNMFLTTLHPTQDLEEINIPSELRAAIRAFVGPVMLRTEHGRFATNHRVHTICAQDSLSSPHLLSRSPPHLSSLSQLQAPCRQPSPTLPTSPHPPFLSRP